MTADLVISRRTVLVHDEAEGITFQDNATIVVRDGVIESVDSDSAVAHRVIPINGTEVARLVFEHGVGVRSRHSYQVKVVDESYFEGESST